MPKWVLWVFVMIAMATVVPFVAESQDDTSWADWSSPMVDPQSVLMPDQQTAINQALKVCATDFGTPLYVVALPSLVEIGAQELQAETYAALLLTELQKHLGAAGDPSTDNALLLLLVEEDKQLCIALGGAWDSDFFARSRRVVKQAQDSISPETSAGDALSRATTQLVDLVGTSINRGQGLSGGIIVVVVLGVLVLLGAAGALWFWVSRRNVVGLQEAVQERSNTLIQQKLKRGADPNAFDDQGYTAAIYAASHGDLQVLQALYEHNADLGLATEQGETPLYSASQNGHPGVAAFLLSKGVPVDPITVHNETPLLIASREGHIEIVAGLLHAGANVNQQDNRGWTALMIALREQHNDVVNLLLNHNADVNLAPKDGAHALMMAVKQEDDTLVRRFIDQGADVHHHARDGMCALRIAVLRGNQDLARRLLNAGADVSAPFDNKEKPAEMAERQGHTELAAYLHKREKRLSACMDILEVVARGDLARLKEIVVQVPRSVNVHSKRTRWTPLLIAVRSDQMEMARILLEHDADVHARSNEGKSAIAYAVDENNLAMVKLLLEGGARIDQIDAEGTDLMSYATTLGRKEMVAFAESFVVQQASGYALFKAVKEDDPPHALTILTESPGCVDARTRHERWTPLLQAARNSNSGMARLLIEYKAQVNLSNTRGMTPLMYAARGGDLELVRLLLNHGAEVRAISREGNSACEFALDQGHARVVMLLQEVEGQLSDLSRAGFPGESEADMAPGEKGRALDIFQAVQENDIKRLKQVIHYWPESIRMRWGPSELTPLHMAVSAGNLPMAALLVAAGADVNAPTREGRMPLHQAVGRADVALVELLVSHQANVDIKSQGQTPYQAAEAAGYEDIVEVLDRTRNDNAS